MAKKINQKRIYLDYAASTPIDKRVSLVMSRAESKFWANPASLHAEGDLAKNALEDCRKRAARILHSRSSEIFFTSGGTEGLNIAIQGIVKKALDKKKTVHVVVSSIEHPAVLEPIKNLLEKKLVEVSFVVPGENGLVKPASIQKELRDNTVLVALMHSNNEIGTIQPVSKISSIIKEFRKGKDKNNFSTIDYPYLLVDASQSVVYEDVSIERLGADILVIDGIKMYGPRGAGIMCIKNGIDLDPLTFGGGQESGKRPGTQNVISIMGMIEALEIAEKEREKESKRILKIRDYAINKILKEVPGSSLNGGLESRLPNNINICIEGTDSEFLVIKLDTLGFAVSAASACSSLSLENSSYVIEALGKKGCGSSSLRFTLGKGTKKSDVDKLISTLKRII